MPFRAGFTEVFCTSASNILDIPPFIETNSRKLESKTAQHITDENRINLMTTTLPTHSPATRLSALGTNPQRATIPVAFEPSCFSPAIAHSHRGITASQPSAVRLENRDGFWEVTMASGKAILPQHQALFYIQHLLGRPGESPVTAAELESAVHELFAEHEDFQPPGPVTWPKSDRAHALKLLRRREQALYRIVDSPDELDPVKNEALRELLEVQEQQQEQIEDLLQFDRDAGVSIRYAILDLYNRLALATNVRGQPHPVIRAFARHLLLRLIIPSTRASRTFGGPYFVYCPCDLHSN